MFRRVFGWMNWLFACERDHGDVRLEIAVARLGLVAAVLCVLQVLTVTR